MKRHQCRHCGQVLDTYAALKRHLASHATPAVIEHTYSVAPPLDVPREVPREVPPSEQAKRTKYSCKCDATFDIWDDLQHHVRSVCRLSRSRSRSSSSSSNRKQTTVYTCAKCGMTFNKRVNLTRHVRNACTADDDTTPPSPKISIREDTTPNHPLADVNGVDWNRLWRRCTRRTPKTAYPWQHLPGSRWTTSIVSRPRSKRTCACTVS